MASSVTGTEVQGHPVTRLPPHLEGNLVYHRPTKFGRPKRAFFVAQPKIICLWGKYLYEILGGLIRGLQLLETVIHQYESSESYHKGQRSKENFKINLEEGEWLPCIRLACQKFELANQDSADWKNLCCPVVNVCGITEMLMSNKQYKNCSFKLTLNDKEATEYKFSAESRQAMEKWVNGLRDAKEFWIHYKRLEFTQKRSNGPHIDVPVTVHNEADNLNYHVFGSELMSLSCVQNFKVPDDSTSSSFTENCEPVQVSVTTWNQITIKVLLPSVFDMEELLTALSTKLQSKRCAGCPICRLQKSSMEVWIVTATGIGHKLDSECDTFDVSKHGKHFYLLEHDHKLLIIHFEDGTFQVIPCLVSIKAKEVPYLPIFADKLSPLGFSNFGLFLVNEKGTSFPFSPEEEPLRHSFQGRLMLKNRALTVSPAISSGSREIQGQRLKKNQQDRMNQKALKIAEKEKCKHFQVGNKEGFSPPDGLVYDKEHYGVSGDLNPPFALADSIEATECIQETADGENGSTEPGPPVGNFISQVGDNNIDELVPFDRTTESGETEKCIKEFPDLSVGIATRVREGSEGSVHEHSSTLIGNPSLSGEHVSIVQRKKDSLKHSEHSAKSDGSSEQTEESTKIESVDFHNEGYLSSGCETNALASTDDSRGKAAAASTSGDEDARVEHNLRVNGLVNFANKTSTFGGETSIEKETIGYESNKDQHAGANEEMAAQNESSENHIETKIPGTPSSDVTLSAQDETPSDKRNCTENLARPVADSVGSTEIHEKFRSRSVLVDKWTDGPYSSCICHERLPVEIHQCDYTIISSPRVLKVVLKACSGRKANEEEVGESNKFSKICLSGWHLRCENGSWIVVEQGRSPSDCDTLAIKFQLSKRLDALFHKEERLWTVIENVHECANEPEDMKNQIQNQGVSDMFAERENTSNDVTPHYQSVSSDLSPRSAHQDLGVTFLGDDAQEVVNTSRGSVKIPGSCKVVPNSRTESLNQAALHSATQQICEKMTTFRRSGKCALGDTKYETITEIVCKSLCSALWDLLSVGLRKRFIGKYTVWNIVQEFKDVSGHVCQTVDWVNAKYTVLGEIQKFQAFVCECLTIGHGALHQWLKGLFRQNEKKLNKYYNQDGIVFHLSREKLEELVSDLSRISSLCFDLNFESWIRTQGYDLNKAAFAFE